MLTTAAKLRRILHGTYSLSIQRLLNQKLTGSNTCSARFCSTQVIVSNFHDINKNLALEDWLYENASLDINESILLIWRSNPCVVIGKFQNPWLECNVPFMKDNSVQLARRKSGGGTVYHDLGNINLSFITHRNDHNRLQNLQFICDVISARWPHLKLSINNRHDILLNNELKVSGTAARMMRLKAYHHCTLLIDSNKELLHRCLKSTIPKDCISTNASESVPAPTSMLTSKGYELCVNEVVETLAQSYANRYSSMSNKVTVTFENASNFDSRKYPGIDSIYSELSSWKWIYGRTPKFTITHTMYEDYTIYILVDKGLIHSVIVAKSKGSHAYSENVVVFNGKRFSQFDINDILNYCRSSTCSMNKSA